MDVVAEGNGHYIHTCPQSYVTLSTGPHIVRAGIALRMNDVDYRSILKLALSGHEPDRPLPPTPTRAFPGSPEKVDVLQWRAGEGQRKRKKFALWHPCDASESEGLGRVVNVLRSGHAVDVGTRAVQGDAEENDDDTMDDFRRRIELLEKRGHLLGNPKVTPCVHCGWRWRRRDGQCSLCKLSPVPKIYREDDA